MNNLWIGVGAALGSGIISAIVYLYFRVRNIEAALLKSQEEVKDAKTISQVRSLDPAELDALLAKDVGAGKRDSKT